MSPSCQGILHHLNRPTMMSIRIPPTAKIDQISPSFLLGDERWEIKIFTCLLSSSIPYGRKNLGHKPSFLSHTEWQHLSPGEKMDKKGRLHGATSISFLTRFWLPVVPHKAVAGSFKNRKPIGEVGCCESGMAERSHWRTERCLRSPLFLSLSLAIYLPTHLFSMYLSICWSSYLSLSFI